MLRYCVAYIGCAAGFVALDALWLTFVGPKLYSPVRDVLLSGGVKPVPAVLFYLLVTGGIVFLAIRPALASGKLGEALVSGAVLGLVAYATYALTDHAIMKNWTWTMTICDSLWGAVAAGTGATTGFLAARLVK